jgi:hypothetical protein
MLFWTNFLLSWSKSFVPVPGILSRIFQHKINHNFIAYFFDFIGSILDDNKLVYLSRLIRKIILF